MIRVIMFMDDLLIFGNTYGTRLCDFPSAAARFCDKFQEMNFQPIQEIQSWTKYINKL